MARGPRTKDLLKVEGTLDYKSYPNAIVDLSQPEQTSMETAQQMEETLEIKLDNPIPEGQPGPAQLSMKDRWAELKKVEQELNKEYKITRSLVRLGSRVNQPVPSIETGLITLDKEVFGCGGAPRGRIIELIGPNSSGKTTLALTIVAEAQKAGGIAAYVDAEHSLDITYSANLGVDVDNLLVSQPDYGEQALGIVEALVNSGHVSVIVIDSVAALVPKAELEGEMGQSHMGLHARLMSQACRKLAGVAEKTGTTLIFINQIRNKIGVMYGSPETTTGGMALQFYSSVRLDIRRREPIKEGEHEIGHKMEIKAIKNKMFTPKGNTILDLYYPGESDITGFDRLGDLVAYGVHECVIEQKGAWFYYKGEKLGQGLDNAKSAIKNNPALEAELRQAIKEKK
jgi:recombination protein RecA